MTLPKLSRQDFLFLKKSGLKFKSKYYIFLYYESVNMGVSFVVSKKHGNAILRNKQKRWIRHMCFEQKNQLVSIFNGFKLLIIPLSLDADFSAKYKDFSWAISRIGRLLK